MNKQKKKDLIIISFVIFIPLLFSTYFATEDVNKEVKKSELGILLNKAHSAYNTNNFDRAINESTEVLNNISSDEFPEQYVEAQMIIGDSYYSLSHYGNYELNHKKSFEAYEKALDIYNNGPKAIKNDVTTSHISDTYRDMGVEYQSMGNYSEAIMAYDKAIEVNPQNAEVWYNKGTSLDSLGKYEEAVEAYEKSNKIEPQKLVAKFSAIPTSGYAPLTVQFTDLSTGNPLYKWWNFGDVTGTGSDINPINHTYFKAGKYKVYLQVSKLVGDNTSEYKYITVNETFYKFDSNNGNDGKSPWGIPLSSLPSYETYHLPAEEGYIVVQNQYDFIDETTSNYSDSDPTDGNGFYISILSPDKGNWNWNGSYTLDEEDTTKGLIPGSQDNVGTIGKDGEKNMPSGRGMKVRIYSPYTKVTVIAVVGDNGPTPWTGCQFGASNKVFKALGLPDSYNGFSKENPNPGYSSNTSDPTKYPVIKYADNPYWVEVSWADQSLPTGLLTSSN